MTDTNLAPRTGAPTETSQQKSVLAKPRPARRLPRVPGDRRAGVPRRHRRALRARRSGVAPQVPRRRRRVGGAGRADELPQAGSGDPALQQAPGRHRAGHPAVLRDRAAAARLRARRAGAQSHRPADQDRGQPRAPGVARRLGPLDAGRDPAALRSGAFEPRGRDRQGRAVPPSRGGARGVRARRARRVGPDRADLRGLPGSVAADRAEPRRQAG